MPNYETGKIYKVVNDVNGMTYYGSTTQTLSRRMSGHRKDYKRGKCKTYELWGNIEDCKIYLIELCPCDLKIELERRERYYIENNDCINKVIPLRNIKEWREVHKEEIALKAKEYNEANKEQISLKVKEYRDNNKEKIAFKKKEYYEANKEQRLLKVKEYNEANKEKISLKKKEYNEANKEKISLQKKEYYKQKKLSIVL